jgi:hypothetical protein
MQKGSPVVEDMTSILVPSYAIATRPALLQQPVMTKLLCIEAVGLKTTVVRGWFHERFHRARQENGLRQSSANLRKMTIMRGSPYMVINKLFAFIDVQKHKGGLSIRQVEAARQR